MQTAVIIDIVVVVVLVIFAIAGMVRGLFRSLAGLLIVVLALVGAGMVASTFAKPVSNFAQPYIRRHIEQKIDNAIQSPKTDESNSSDRDVAMPEVLDEELHSNIQESPNLGKKEIAHILSKIGLDETLSTHLSDSVRAMMRDTSVSLTTAVAESLSQTIIYILLFVVSFLILLLLLRLLMMAMDLVLKLPVLNFCNTVGGGVFGIIEGALFLFLAIWVLRWFGMSFETPVVRSTCILRFFADHTPIDVLSTLLQTNVTRSA